MCVAIVVVVGGSSGPATAGGVYQGGHPILRLLGCCLLTVLVIFVDGGVGHSSMRFHLFNIDVLEQCDYYFMWRGGVENGKEFYTHANCLGACFLFRGKN